MSRRFLTQSRCLLQSNLPRTAHGGEIINPVRWALGNAAFSSSASFSSQAIGDYQTLRCEIDSPVGKITIARPKALNAVSMEVCLSLTFYILRLCASCLPCLLPVHEMFHSGALDLQAMQEIVHASHHLDRTDDVKAIIITGEGNKAFAAGADIKEMASQQYSEVRS